MKKLNIYYNTRKIIIKDIKNNKDVYDFFINNYYKYIINSDNDDLLCIDTNIVQTYGVEKFLCELIYKKDKLIDIGINEKDKLKNEEKYGMIFKFDDEMNIKFGYLLKINNNKLFKDLKNTFNKQYFDKNYFLYNSYIYEFCISNFINNTLNRKIIYTYEL